MEQLLDSLNDLTPVVAVGSLAIFMTLERWLPYFEHGIGRGRQRWHNLGMVAIAFLINATLGGVMLAPAELSSAGDRLPLRLRLQHLGSSVRHRRPGRRRHHPVWLGSVSRTERTDSLGTVEDAVQKFLAAVG
jgi:hypothetical protein